MLEQHLRQWLAEITSMNCHYQHLNDNPGTEFVWFTRAGDDNSDTIDGDGEPDTVYFDLELYAATPGDQLAACALLRAQRDYRGLLVGTDPDSYVDDLSIIDQRDDYEPQANAESLPPFAAQFRLIVTGYQAD